MGPWLLLLLACGGEGDSGGPGPDGGAADGGAADGGAGDGGAADGGGAGGPTLLPPVGDRVLLYTGHGGLPPQGTGTASFLDVQARWEALGFGTHARDTLPDDLGIYRLMVLVAPGATAAVPWTAEEIGRIDASRAQGNRVLVLGDLAMCGSAELADLLAGLGGSVSFTGEGADRYQLVTGEVGVAGQPTAGVTTIEARDPCWVAASSGEELLRDGEGRGLLVAGLPADGGEVLLLGDLEVLDDNLLGEADNAVLADNLARVTP